MAKMMAATFAADAGGGGGGGGAGGGVADFASQVSTLPEEIRSAPAMANVKDFGDLAGQFVNAQGLIGRKAPERPADDAAAEDWGTYYGALGRPDGADGYTAPTALEGQTLDEGMVSWFRESAHAAGLTDRQFTAMANAWGELQAANGTAAGEANVAVVEAGMAALRTKWGDDAEARIEVANQGFKTAFGDRLEEAMALRLADGSHFGDNALVVEAFEELGSLISENNDLPGGGAGGSSGSSQSQALAEIDRIMGEAGGDPKHPYVDTKHPEHTAARRKMAQLYAVAYPGVEGGGGAA